MQPYIYTDGLETGRLYTRFLQHDDYLAWAEFFRDGEASRFLPFYGTHVPEERALHWVEKQMARHRDQTYGLQMLLDKETHEPVGQCGLLLQHVNDVPELEVGYHILKKHWGKGYAPEAAQMFRDYGFENTSVDSIVSIIDINNVKSQRVAAKNGMRPGPQTRWLNFDINLYRITRTEWLNRK